MKKVLFATIAVAILASCTALEEPKTSENDAFQIVSSMPSSKVSLGEKTGSTYAMVWNEGDRILVNGVSSKPLSASQAGSSTASFTVEGFESVSYDVAYPVSAFDGSKVVLPSEQAFVPSGFDPSAVILVGHSSSVNVTLQHACAFVKVTVDKASAETIKSLKLYTPDNTPLSGVYDLDYASATLSENRDLSNFVSISNAAGIPYSDSKVTAVFVIPAGQYFKGFEFAVSTTDGAQMNRKAYETGVTLVPGQMLAMPAVAFCADAAKFSGGSGTKEDPYRITTARDIQQISQLSSFDGKYFVQESDIRVDSDFTSISSTLETAFSGSYNGNGFCISGLNKPLFGYLAGCDICDLYVRGEISSSENQIGTLAGVMVSGKLSKVRSLGTVKGKKYVGGLIGSIDSKDIVTVDKCTSFSSVCGESAVGGIAGYSHSGAAVKITNSLYSGRHLELIGNSGSDGFGMLGGVIGWMKNESAGSQNILNCAVYVDRMSYVNTFGSYSTVYPCVGGIIGYQSGDASSSSIQGCCSNFQLCKLFRDGMNMTKIIDNNSSEAVNYGAIYGRSSTSLKYASCYYDNSTKMGPSATSLTSVTSCGQTGRYSVLVANLNAFVGSYQGEALCTWEKDECGCVVPVGLTTSNGSSMPLRISIIGDSISTYRSWIPIGYAVYYYDNKTVDSVTSDVYWDSMYWSRLAYDLLPDGVIEKNIAWSGSCVSSCDNQVTKPGFSTRMEASGIGAPDIVLIHGGTNDWNRNVNGTRVDNTEGVVYTEIPSEAAMQKLFDADINSLNTKYYLDSYVKLVRQIHIENPEAQIVLITGDRQDLAMVAGVRMIAEHYSDYCRIVDMRTRGYNNLPKFSGSHPTAAGHYTMAVQIYSEILDLIK